MIYKNAISNGYIKSLSSGEFYSLPRSPLVLTLVRIHLHMKCEERIRQLFVPPGKKQKQAKGVRKCHIERKDKGHACQSVYLFCGAFALCTQTNTLQTQHAYLPINSCKAKNISIFDETRRYDHLVRNKSSKLPTSFASIVALMKLRTPISSLKRNEEKYARRKYEVFEWKLT